MTIIPATLLSDKKITKTAPWHIKLTVNSTRNGGKHRNIQRIVVHSFNAHIVPKIKTLYWEFNLFHTVYKKNCERNNWKFGGCRAYIFTTIVLQCTLPLLLEVFMKNETSKRSQSPYSPDLCPDNIPLFWNWKLV